MIILMVVFRRVECAGWLNGGDNLAFQHAALLKRCLGRFGCLPLFITVREDPPGDTVTPVAKLGIGRQRIMRAPEDMQQALVGDGGGIIDDTHSLDMPRTAGGHLLVAGFLTLPLR